LTLLEVSGLRLSFDTERGRLDLFSGLDFTLGDREIVGIVGESGSGKSTLAYAVTRLLPANAKILGGTITFEGEQLLELSEREMAQVRGKKITMVFQDPGTSLNPVFRIKDQMKSVLKATVGLEGAAAIKHAVDLLREVELPDPEGVLECFPFELSGGMQQRVMVAMALSSNPRLIIADEPTSAVDATIQAEILDLLRKIRAEREFSMILITHSIVVAEEVCDRIVVMYGGEIVEDGDAKTIVTAPMHPYAKALLKCIPRPRRPRATKSMLPVVEGHVPDLTAPPPGCRFNPRCPYVMEICTRERPRFYQAGGTKALCFLYEPEGGR